MNDDSYPMSIWIGVNISKMLALYKCGINPPLGLISEGRAQCHTSYVM